jgi:glycosyltransferase involved in cell wall biosynthesis
MPAKPILNWERLWFPAHVQASLIDGYLSESTVPSPNAGTPLDTLREMPCLVLLGVPGMGKTSEMQRQVNAAEMRGELVDFVSLGRLTAPAELETLILGRDHSRVRGSSPGRVWNIFLDGLDEAIAQLTQVEQTIPRILRILAQHQSFDSIRLRISCRSAEWPQSLEAELRSIWNSDDVAVFELGPLRRSDVAAAVETLAPLQPAVRFLEQIRRHEAEPLASRPVTLNMLLNVYGKDADLPTEQVQLYRKGLLASIEEANVIRRKNRQTWRLDPGSKLMVAARIAAACVFSDNSEIWTGLNSDIPPAGAILLSEIAGGHEPALGTNFPVSEAELHEVLLTSLFNPINNELFVWSHRTFAEYLAAHYLLEHGLSAEQCMNLLRASSAAEETVPQQLREVAAWLASMHPDFFRALIHSEPDILLRSDVASAAPEDRAALIRELLRRFENQEIHDFHYESRLRYDRLAHPQLAKQLTPYIASKRRGIVVRRVAIDIAEANSVYELADLLADVALDPSDDHHIRAQATAALSKIKVNAAVERLYPLIANDSPDDDDDDLRGYALRALWPDHISLRVLLDALTEPKKENYFGAYAFFLSDLQLPTISGPEAILLLDWLSTMLMDEERSGRFEHVIPRLLYRVWEEGDDASVLERLADFFITAVDQHRHLASENTFQQFVSASVRTDDRQRRRLIKAIIRRAKDNGEGLQLDWLTPRHPMALVSESDLSWFVEELLANESTTPKDVLVDLIIANSHGRNIDELDYLWTAGDQVPALAQSLVRDYSVALDSTAAKWQRENLIRQESLAAKKRNIPSFDVMKRIEQDLSKIEQGSSYGWWELNLLFFTEADGRLDVGREFTGSITKTSIWTDLPTTLRGRVISTGYRYLVENTIQTKSWLGTSTFHRPAAAGYRALRLLRSEAPQLFSDLVPDVWKKWASAVLGTSFNDDGEERKARNAIAEQCYSCAPVQFCRIMARLIKRSHSEFIVRTITDMIGGCFDERLGALLFQFLERPFGDKRNHEIIRFLAHKRYSAITQLTLEALARGIVLPNTQLASERELVIAASSLLEADAKLVWPSLAKLLTANKKLARDILENTAQGWFFSEPPFTTQLAEDALADFYIWAYREFGPRAEQASGRARVLSAIDHMEHLRDAALRDLAGRATPAAVSAIMRIAAALPEVDWLKYQIIDARRAMTAKLWKRRKPADVIGIVALYSPKLEVRSTKAIIVEAASAYQSATIAPPLNPVNLSNVKPSETVTLLLPVKPTSVKSRRILTVATEWSSRHGGISTLNRDLCIALASIGHEVVCFVAELTSQEASDAATANVRLVGAPADPALDDSERLLLFVPDSVSPFVPELVIGHDHITGSAAYHIASRVYGGIPYVHFIHTLPEEAERHKTRNGSSILVGAQKADVQMKQCRTAHLVVGVGPRIHRELETRVGQNYSIRVVQMRPGLDKNLMSKKIDVRKVLSAYCLFLARLEDGNLKGADFACKIITTLNVDWKWSPAKRPMLIMRGFDPLNIDRDIKAIGGMEAKEFLRPREYSADAAVIAADIRMSSVMMMPSRCEGFGLVALEAIAAGIPVVVTSSSGVGELLLESAPAIGHSLAEACVADVNGDDPEATTKDWAIRIQKIIADPLKAFAQAEQLRTLLGPVLNWETAAANFSEEFESVL